MLRRPCLLDAQSGRVEQLTGRRSPAATTVRSRVRLDRFRELDFASPRPRVSGGCRPGRWSSPAPRQTRRCVGRVRCLSFQSRPRAARRLGSADRTVDGVRPDSVADLPVGGRAAAEEEQRFPRSTLLGSFACRAYRTAAPIHFADHPAPGPFPRCADGLSTLNRDRGPTLHPRVHRDPPRSRVICLTGERDRASFRVEIPGPIRVR